MPPLDESTAARIGAKINVNCMNFALYLAHATRQYLINFLSNQYFFKITLPLAPSESQSEWGAFITEQLNRPLRKSQEYFQLHCDKWGAVVAHGLGPITWRDSDRWLPEFVAIEDLRVATDTKCDFRNLEWYGERKVWTPGELLEEAFGPDSKWEKKEVMRILRAKKNVNWDFPPNSYDYESQPEKFYELAKQDGAWYAGDAMPAIPLWHFTFKDETDPDNAGWFRLIVPAEGATGVSDTKFLWRSERPVARHWNNLLHVQYGDLNIKRPALYKSVRSLGFELMEPCYWENITLSRALQHVHDNFNVWFRSTDPADKARGQVQEFAFASVIKPGLSVVPDSERHQIDNSLLESLLGQLTQKMQQAASTYTQQIDTGTKKEQTAFETSVKLQQVNAMLGGLMLKAFKQEQAVGEEICRRFCISNSSDLDVQLFQKRCKRAGIPRRFLNVEQWDIEPVTQLGMGNPMIAQATATQLVDKIGMFEPEAQQEIKHDFVVAVTGDSRRAARWVKLGVGNQINNAQRDAQAMFGTLMQGVPVPPREGLSPIDQIEAILPLLAGKIHLIEQRDNMATPSEVQGLQAVFNYLNMLVQQLGQDPSQKERVAKYGNDLKELSNLAKGLAQRGAEARAKRNGNGDPAAMAKVQAAAAMNAVKLRSKQASDSQKLRHKEMSFRQQQQHKAIETEHEMALESERAGAELAHSRLRSVEE